VIPFPQMIGVSSTVLPESPYYNGGVTNLTDLTDLKAPPLVMAFRYMLEERVSADPSGSFHHLERWDVEVRIDDPDHDQQGRIIGDAVVIILNLEEGRDVRDLADPVRGEWQEVAGLEVASPGDHLLVLDRVWVDPEFRGNRLGPIIAAAVIERLGRGCRLAACFPAPFEGPCRPDDRPHEVEALGRIWAEVGFRHWRDGVWMLDLGRSA
jgi:GNAT superfamily N-acetyltransferase